LRLVVVCTVQFAFLASMLVLSACYTAAGKLTSFDRLAEPGAPVELLAKIENDGPGFLNRDLSDVEIEFLAKPAAERPPAAPEPAPHPGGPVGPGAVSLGTAKSGKGGMAVLPWKAPLEPGNHFFWVRLKDPSRMRLREPEVLFTISVLTRDQPVLITDIDNTIARTKLMEAIGHDPGEMEALPGSPQVLGELSRTYRIVYLTARSTYLAHRTRNWLAFHGFPAGPVLLRDLHSEWGNFNWSEGEFKKRFIRDEIKRRWPEVRWGIGNTEGDIEAYAGNGIHALVLADAPLRVPEAYKNLAKTVANWDEVKKAIAP
jgi:hypothetical protein